MPNAKADYNEVQIAFVNLIEDCKNRIQLIPKFLDDNMKINFDNMNWDHVEDTGRLLEQLDEILTSLGLSIDT